MLFLVLLLVVDGVKQEEVIKNGDGVEQKDGNDGEVKFVDILEKKQELEVFIINYYIGLQLGKMFVLFDFFCEVQEWMSMCCSSDFYKEGVNFFVVIYIKNMMFFDDVFEFGEVRLCFLKKKFKR